MVEVVDNGNAKYGLRSQISYGLIESEPSRDMRRHCSMVIGCCFVRLIRVCSLPKACNPQTAMPDPRGPTFFTFVNLAKLVRPDHIHNRILQS